MTPDLDAMTAPPDLSRDDLVWLMQELRRAQETARWREQQAEHFRRQRDQFERERNDAVRALDGATQEYADLVASRRSQAATIGEMQTRLATADRLAAEAAEECNRLRAELAAAQGEVAQEQRRRERAEAERDRLRGGSRALPWRDAKTDPPPVGEEVVVPAYAVLERVNQSTCWSLRPWEWFPKRWLPLSALEPGECVTVDLPALGAIEDLRHVLLLDLDAPDAGLYLPKGTQIPAKWKGQPLTLTLTVRK